MSDYDSENESVISDATPSEYTTRSNTELDDLDEQLNEHEENKKKFKNLIDDKYLIVMQFNKGLLDPSIYFSKLKEINEQLEEIEYEDSETNQKLIEEEIKFKTMLDELVLKISKKYPSQLIFLKKYNLSIHCECYLQKIQNVLYQV